MFCFQCEQTAGGKGCTFRGVCGKSPEAATLQDLLIHGLKGIAVYGHLAGELGVRDRETDRFVEEGLFTTVTNVSFDTARLEDLIRKSAAVKERIKTLFLDAYRKKHGREFTDPLPDAAAWQPANASRDLLEQGRLDGVMTDTSMNEDIRSLRELLKYGLKGMAAYADHASILGRENEEVTAFLHKGLAALAWNKAGADELVALNMELGKANLACMETLDGANTGAYGHPVPTQVPLGLKKGPAIIVSGHDLHDLKGLLEQTEGKGINIYTHGEMLPSHGYPELKKHKHLVGHFGTAWQNQQKEFDGIPAAVLMTTNCIQEPRPSYRDNIFTTGLVAFPGVTHIAELDGKKDFGPVIERALKLGGFREDAPGREVLVGFGHNTVLGVADKVIDAVKTGKIRHFFLIGGCDGAKPGRSYYTEFAEKVPKDCMVLTLACGKFRFNTLDFGTVAELPRLLDIGQCNDAYSAVKIAAALAGAFNCGVNDLPLSLVLSWYEQKAVAILLTLLSLGIKNIRLGPTLPAFVSPNVLKVLVEKFAIKPITNPDDDLKAMLSAGTPA